MSSKPSTQVQSDKPILNTGFVFGRENYILMIAGIVVIIIGFALMMGGASNDPNVFNPEIFSTRRIVLAPIVVLLGFVIEVFAIFRKSKD